ncbi:MAG: PepSY domain-containing protein [Verrucomicrobiae bacterium]|nr:PepSY domain-containing protein [Verrucomicrobiae bacterium]
MNIKMILSVALAAGLLTGCECTKCEKCEKGEAKEASQAELLSQAKISKETAQASALAKVPGGTVKDAELEKEKGKLIWSFDVAIPDSKDIKEVAVDATTGDVIAVDTESPEDQAKEAAEDAAKAKKKGEKEDKD